MTERLKSGNDYAFPHCPELFKQLGFSRRERVGMFMADLAAALTQNNPSEGGIWPSDVQISWRIEDLGFDPEQFAR